MKSNRLSVDHLLGIKYLTEDDLHLIFQTATHFKEVINRPIKKVPSLRDITIANLFFENSTRTKLSFEIAEKRLSADVINFSFSGSSISKGENLIDTINNIIAMKVDIIVLRHPSPGSALFISKNIDSCIINAGDGTHEHPSQALLDAYSLIEKLGDLNGKKIAIVGDVLHSRVALSNIFILRALGAQIKLCAPKSLLPKHIESLGVKVGDDLIQTLKWCDAVNMLRIQNERTDVNFFPSTREYSRLYGLDKVKFEKVKKDILILHPGPINRGVEITSDIADSKHAIILDQVENGVAIRMAIIYLLASKLKMIDYDY
ncbi:MAG: aspartate carbamoyltransferase [Flavobacteriaceae bacterium]|nr:aspartate carbamoyltransferase [Flavobacteriaceae bacterium]|tara:strand:+ start:2501 stop:3451 length:951 start_codon:yes stop_codon:yes gene_type:complete